MAVEETPCELCGGRGTLLVDDMHERLCRCAWLRMMKKHLGPEIAAVAHTQSPLYVLGSERGKPAMDGTKKSLFIKSGWRGLLPHLKWVLFYKGINFRFKVVTDDLILNVRLGKYTFLRKKDQEEKDLITYDNLSDLVESPDLVLVRLGRLGHKNKAAAGYVKEALMIRDVAYKPTWILEEPNAPFIPGEDNGKALHYTYSEELAAYIWDHFDVLDLTDGAPVEEPEEPSGMNVSDVDETAENESAENESAENEGSDDMAAMAAVLGPEKSEKKFKPKKWRKGGSR